VAKPKTRAVEKAAERALATVPKEAVCK